MNKNILILLLAGGVGDVMLSLAALKPLKELYKGCRITMMVKKGMESIVGLCPLADDILPVEGGELRGKNFDYWLKEIKKRRFDIGIALWSRASEAHLLFRAGIPVRVGQDSRLLYSFLFSHKVSVRSEHGDLKSHWTQVMLDYVRAIGAEAFEAEIPIIIPDDGSVERMKKLLEDISGGKGPFWGLQVCKGLAVTPDAWPCRYFASLGDAICRRLGGTVVLTGSERELPVIECVADMMNAPHCITAGKTSLTDLVSMMRSLSGFVAPDTGPGHIAALAGIPVVSIFALKSDFPNRWKPFGRLAEAVAPEKRSCPVKNCIKEKCSRCFECYNDIDPDYVAERLAFLCGLAGGEKN